MTTSPVLRPITDWPTPVQEAVQAFTDVWAPLDVIRDQGDRETAGMALHRWLIPALMRLPVPEVIRAPLRPSQVTALREAEIMDTMNLSLMTAVLRLGEPLLFEWHQAHRRALIHTFGPAASGFRNHDGLFGLWWFQVKDHPLIAPEALFNVCAGPRHIGVRAGVRFDLDDRRLGQDTVNLEALIVCAWHARVAQRVAEVTGDGYVWPLAPLTPWAFCDSDGVD